MKKEVLVSLPKEIGRESAVRKNGKGIRRLCTRRAYQRRDRPLPKPGILGLGENGLKRKGRATGSREEKRKKKKSRGAEVPYLKKLGS